MGSSLFIFGGCGQQGRLADLHRFDTETGCWEELPPAPLKGRGGAGFVASPAGLLVVGGFAGVQTNDVCFFDLEKQAWTMVLPDGHDKFAGFSVSAGATLSGKDLVVFFGGEVHESAKGHEGAGLFSTQLVLLDTKGQHVANAAPPGPQARGWAAACAAGDELVVFGGLAGDDSEPQRLADTWVLGEQAAL